jgi:hypothetical protein
MVVTNVHEVVAFVIPTPSRFLVLHPIMHSKEKGMMRDEISIYVFDHGALSLLLVFIS